MLKTAAMVVVVAVVMTMNSGRASDSGCRSGRRSANASGIAPMIYSVRVAVSAVTAL